MWGRSQSGRLQTAYWDGIITKRSGWGNLKDFGYSHVYACIVNLPECLQAWTLHLVL